MKRIQLGFVVICLTTFLMSSNYVTAQREGESGSSRTTRISLVFWGSITTFLARKKSDTWFFIGWAVMLAGSVSSATRLAHDVVGNLLLVGDDTQVDMYSGGDRPVNLQASVDAKDYLEKIEMDSFVAANSPLANHLPMSEVLRQFNMDPQRVGQLLLHCKSLADSLLGGKEFGSKIMPINYKDFQKSTGIDNMSHRELNVIKNYLRLRNIALTRI